MAGPGYSRSKRPAEVRRALLAAAAQLAVEQGLTAVTVQAVADEAGVTKGSLTHHFPNKGALMAAVVEELVSEIDRRLDASIAADPEPWGSFTRAYVEMSFEMSAGGPWAALAVSALTDPGLRAVWAAWYEGRLERHAATDGNDVRLEVARLAADGVWLADLSGTPLSDQEAVRAELISSTRPTPEQCGASDASPS